jgi:hypothetical protein
MQQRAKSSTNRSAEAQQVAGTSDAVDRLTDWTISSSICKNRDPRTGELTSVNGSCLLSVLPNSRSHPPWAEIVILCGRRS